MNKRESVEHGGPPAVIGDTGALAEAPISRARAIKLAGATITAGALAVFMPQEADAKPNRRKRRRRRRRRQQAAARRRRQSAVVSNSGPVVDFGDVSLGVPATELVTIANNGGTPVTLDPTVVGDGFALGDLSGTDLTLEPGETVQIPVVANPTAGGASTGALQIRDASDGLLLETVDLTADAA